MRLRTTLPIVAMALCLAGCGGGGGGGVSKGVNSSLPMTPAPTPVNPPQPPPSPDSFRTAEYSRMRVLDQIRAADAYALGYTGAGVTIGIVDFNFNLSSSEVNFSPASLGPNPQMRAIYEAQAGSAVDPNLHGFATASEAAARKNDSGIHGVAFDAQVLAVDFLANANPRQITRGGVLQHVSDPWTYITSRGARIISISIGYDSGSPGGSPPVGINETYALASAAIAVVNGALLVSAAGNGGGAGPWKSNLDILDDLRATQSLNGPGGFIIAGAADANNQIASFSNRAGPTANYYMVAPGISVVLPWDSTFALLSGTSFAPPLIAGAAALVLQRWPNLTGKQLADVLLNSATDLGEPGVDPIYGHGLLNIAAALQPLGVTTLAVADGIAPAVSGAALVLGPAFGDAPAFQQALSQVMMLDGFGRDYLVDLSGRARTRPNLPDLFGVMEQQLGWRHARFSAGSELSLAYAVKRGPADGLVPFQTLAGPTDHSTHQTVFRLSGAGDGFDWAAGTGLSLRDGMTGGEGLFAPLSLTNPFPPMVGAAPGSFASIRVPLAENTSLSFGGSHADNQGVTEHMQTPFKNSADAASLRLDHEAGSSLFSLQLGGVLETGGFMGSLAAGGLNMAERASTVWTTLSAETALNKRWSLKGAFTLASSATAHPQASLISEIGPVFATSFALGVAGTNVFRAGDMLGFAMGQPLRAERAPVTLVSGVARDWTTGGVIMGEKHSSLVPSGRELDIEAGYYFSMASWRMGANLGYAIDANHAKGENAVLALFTTSRAF